MVYRDSPDVLAARIESLKADLAALREENAMLRDKLTRAMSALKIIAHSKKVADALDAAKLGKERARIEEAMPSDIPPPPPSMPEESRDPRASSESRTKPKKRAAKKRPTKKSVSGGKKRRPSSGGSKPAGEGVYVLVDRKKGVDR